MNIKNKYLGDIITSFDETVEIGVMKNDDYIEVIPMDDMIFEIVWSEEYKRLICKAKQIPTH